MRISTPFAVLLLICAPLLNTLQAQSVAFPSDSARWIEFFGVWDTGRPISSEYNQFVMQGDTLIQGKVYTKIMWDQTYIMHGFGGSYKPVEYIFGMRADSNNRVWLVHGPRNDELMLYDFNLQVGDRYVKYNTFPLLNGGGSFFLDSTVTTIQKIDVINIGGIQRRRWWMDSTNFEDAVIEGIGHIKSVFSPGVAIVGLDFGNRLDCYEYRGLPLNGNPYNLGSCNLPSNHTPPSPTPEVKVWPNPVSKLLNIELNLPGQFQASLWNLSGQQVMDEIPGGGLLSIDLGDLGKGFYWLRIAYEDQLVYRKIIVQ